MATSASTPGPKLPRGLRRSIWVERQKLYKEQDRLARRLARLSLGMTKNPQQRQQRQQRQQQLLLLLEQQQEQRHRQRCTQLMVLLSVLPLVLALLLLLYQKLQQ
jgi:hypothetical protein